MVVISDPVRRPCPLQDREQSGDGGICKTVERTTQPLLYLLRDLGSNSAQDTYAKNSSLEFACSKWLDRSLVLIHGELDMDIFESCTNSGEVLSEREPSNQLPKLRKRSPWSTEGRRLERYTSDIGSSMVGLPVT